MPGQRLSQSSTGPTPAGRSAVRRTVRLVTAAVSIAAAAGIGAAAIALRGSPSRPDAASRPVPERTVAPGAVAYAQSVPVRIPTVGAYFGIDPNPDPSLTIQAQDQTVAREVGRPFGIVSFYINWTQPPPITGMEAVTSMGSIPMLNMHCGVDDAQIIAGQWDGLIRRDAEALKALGSPVFFRWFWEMNLTNVGNHPTCLGAPNDLSLQESNFIGAYQRIWQIFHDVGASNVSFVWAPSDAAAAPKDWTSFYPGNSYVDWIGADLYDRNVGAFESLYGASGGFYDTFATPTYGKPLMLSETGAVGSANQQAWLSQIETYVPSRFQDLHAVVYVDATDSLGDYELVPGTAGMAQFMSLGRSPFFSQVG